MAYRNRLTVAQRFANKTERHPCGCLLWIGSTRGRYGRMMVDGTVRSAHHIAWFLEHGTWPTFLRHDCDTPLCAEVKHLTPSDSADNMADRDVKGRQAAGDRHGRSRLTAADVFDIRWASGLGASRASLAAAYGIDWTSMDLAVRGVTWRHA